MSHLAHQAAMPAGALIDASWKASDMHVVRRPSPNTLSVVNAEAVAAPATNPAMVGRTREAQIRERKAVAGTEAQKISAALAELYEKHVVGLLTSYKGPAISEAMLYFAMNVTRDIGVKEIGAAIVAAPTLGTLLTDQRSALSGADAIRVAPLMLGGAYKGILSLSSKNLRADGKHRKDEFIRKRREQAFKTVVNELIREYGRSGLDERHFSEAVRIYSLRDNHPHLKEYINEEKKNSLQIEMRILDDISKEGSLQAEDVVRSMRSMIQSNFGSLADIEAELETCLKFVDEYAGGRKTDGDGKVMHVDLSVSTARAQKLYKLLTPCVDHAKSMLIVPPPLDEAAIIP